jgi:hypothetical protein
MDSIIVLVIFVAIVIAVLIDEIKESRWKK